MTSPDRLGVRPFRGAGAAPLRSITINVYGEPAPQGSKRARPIYRGRGATRVFTGRVALVEMSPRVGAWRRAVADAARREAERIGLAEPLGLPVSMRVTFTVRGKPTARPSWWPAGVPWSRRLWWSPATAPDLSKLLRATEDALTGVVWADDARVVRVEAVKCYAGDPREPDALDEPGAVIHVTPLREEV